MATKRTKVEQPVEEPVEDLMEEENDELEELDEAVEGEEEAAPKKTRKAKAKVVKPERLGFSTAEAAAQLGIAPVRLRRILRSEDGGFADKEYTRYDLTQEQIDKVAELLTSGVAAKAEKKPRKSKKTANVEAAAEEVEDELSDLEDMGDDETEEESEEDDDLELEEDDDEEEEE